MDIETAAAGPAAMTSALTARPSLLGLARTYVETQARLWPELTGTPAVPTITDAVVEAIADDFERRFRAQLVDVFNPAGLRRVWADIGLGYVRFSDEGSNPRSLDQQLIERWRNAYNTVRPHNSLGYRPPAPAARRPCPLASATPQQADRGEPLAGQP